MPKYQAEDSHAKTVERLLHARDLPHLRGRKYGATVIVESGPTADPYKHLRFTRDGVHIWQLHIANHRGRWEYTPFRGQLDELVTLVADTLPWTLQSVHGYPERTSDRKHKYGTREGPEGEIPRGYSTARLLSDNWALRHSWPALRRTSHRDER